MALGMDLGLIGTALGVLIVTAYSAINSRRANKQTQEVGNGFAKEVKESLRRIENKIDDHIAAHAENDVRTKH